MEPELEKYFNNYFDLLKTDGWQQLLADIKNDIQNTNNINGADSVEDLFFKKGQLNILLKIFNFESTVNAAFEDASKPETEESTLE